MPVFKSWESVRELIVGTKVELLYCQEKLCIAQSAVY